VCIEFKAFSCDFDLIIPGRPQRGGRQNDAPLAAAGGNQVLF
jgi:hypothetical protein